MNADRIRCTLGPRVLLTGPTLKQGIVWKFPDGRPRSAHYLVFSSVNRCFRAGRVTYNGYGTRRAITLPKKVADVLLSLLPDDEIARATALSLTRNHANNGD